MSTDSKQRLTVWQLFIFALSIYVLVILLWETFFRPPPEVAQILQTTDSVICFVFIGDFFGRLFRAHDKLQFIKWGWIDLVSSIPALDVFRWGRLVRVLRIFRILRAVRSTKLLLTFFFANRAKSTFASAMLISLTLIVFASIAILNLEDGNDSNIKGAEDAMWWAISTMTTVGYGDRFPVTTEGRILGAFLMTAGVGLFGIFTGFVASWFVGGKGNNSDDVVKRLHQIEKMLEQRFSEGKTTITIPNEKTGAQN